MGGKSEEMETHLTVMDTSQGCWISTVKKHTSILKQAKIASSLVQVPFRAI